MKAKIANGAQAEMSSCGRYWPKKVCSCSTPSTIDSITPPVRSRGEPAGPQRDDLVVETAAQRFLHPRRGAMREHRARMVEHGAQQDRDGDAGQRQHQFTVRRLAEYQCQQLPRKAKRAMP